jgi:hypothetical protein
VVRVELKDGLGHARWVTADLLDSSEQGIGVSMMTPLKTGLTLAVCGKIGSGPEDVRRRAGVSWCMEATNGAYRIGLEFLDGKSGAQTDQEPGHQVVSSDPLELDCYEIMQLSPNADAETIERVYRILAQRYHPDNIHTGSSELFIQVSEAHRILTDPKLRAGYDARHRETKQLHWKIFDQAQSASGQEGEQRKRQGILSLLYAKTLEDPEHAALGILTFEQLLGCPREHLESALWYLRGKNYIQRADNGRYSITVEGFDRVEESNLPPKTENRQLTKGEDAV